jgi:trehalose-6-phosphatase
MAIEITAALGWTKGSAVRTIVEHVGAGAMPLYAGDEANDEDALAEAAALGGVALGIGPRAPATAQQRLASPEALAQFLAKLLQCGKPSPLVGKNREQNPLTF